MYEDTEYIEWCYNFLFFLVFRFFDSVDFLSDFLTGYFVFVLYALIHSTEIMFFIIDFDVICARN